jgi:hypothetical protein
MARLAWVTAASASAESITAVTFWLSGDWRFTQTSTAVVPIWQVASGTAVQAHLSFRVAVHRLRFHLSPTGSNLLDVWSPADRPERPDSHIWDWSLPSGSEPSRVLLNTYSPTFWTSPSLVSGLVSFLLTALQLQRPVTTLLFGIWLVAWYLPSGC